MLSELQQKTSRFAIFEDFSDAEASEILEQGMLREHARNTVIFQEGSPGRHLYVLLEGCIGVYSQDKYIAKLKAGDVFGEMAVLNQKPRSATTRAITDVSVFTLSEEQINGMLHQSLAVRFLLNIIHVISARLEVGNTWVASSLEAMRSDA